MGERAERGRRKRRPPYHDYLTADPPRRGLGLLRWLRERRDRRRLASAPLPGGDGWYGGGDAGGAGVREPRRPLPRSPQGAAELPRD
jgi:hypothetical protein